MQTLNPNPAITQELFEKVVKSITEFGTKASMPGNTQMLLTEGDLQAWIFHQLLLDLGKESDCDDKTDSQKVGIHCNPYFLDESGTLAKVPDIVILDKKEYCIDSPGSLFQRKGFTAWGSSVMLELKLFRVIHVENQQLQEWKKDLDKLENLKYIHYPKASREVFPSICSILQKKYYSNNI